MNNEARQKAEEWAGNEYPHDYKLKVATQRLVNLCRAVAKDSYLAGFAAAQPEWHFLPELPEEEIMCWIFCEDGGKPFIVLGECFEGVLVRRQGFQFIETAKAWCYVPTPPPVPQINNQSNQAE